MSDRFDIEIGRYEWRWNSPLYDMESAREDHWARSIDCARLLNPNFSKLLDTRRSRWKHANDLEYKRFDVLATFQARGWSLHDNE